MKSLREVTAEFGEAYLDAKASDEVKKDLQKEFFSAIDEELSQYLARKTVTMPGSTVSEEKDRERWLADTYPGWRFVQWKDDDSDDMIIEEDPSIMGYVYVNLDDETVYGRSRVESSPSLDDEALREDDPELWEEVSNWPDPWYSLALNAMQSFAGFEIDEDHVVNFMVEQNIQRTLKPIEFLTNEQIDRIHPYLVPGAVTVRLTPPRPAKPEELPE